jgi:DNA primase
MIEAGSSKYDISTNQGKNALLQDVVTMIVQMHGTVVIDQSLRLTAKKLDLSLQSVYFEYNRAVRGRRNQKPQEEKPSIQLS